MWSYHINTSISPERLIVVTAISNYVQYQSRYRLYKNFEKMVNQSGAILITVETALGERPFEVTVAENPHHIQLRTVHELWHKENMINLGIQQAVQLYPQSSTYFAWIDSDISFARHWDWPTEIVHQLQHFDFIQPWSICHDLNDRYETIQTHRGFAWSYLNSHILNAEKYYNNLFHSGYAWAARRDALDKTGGLLDVGILGSSDHHIALALIGQVEKSLPKGISNDYIKEIMRYQDRCESLIKRNVGYMEGTILHYSHGHKKNRKYGERWNVLLNNDFSPDLDLKRDTQGLYQLTDRSIGLRDGIRKYFRERNEDELVL